MKYYSEYMTVILNNQSKIEKIVINQFTNNT